MLRVRTRVEDRSLVLSFEDNGPGMTPDTRDKVFEPLFSTKSFGVGLGLAIVDRAMAEHGGGLELSSRAGEGTRAVLWLPVARSDEQAA